MDIKDYQKHVNDWQIVTFPNMTPKSCYAHMQKEMKELGEALNKNRIDDKEVAYEIADIIILCLGIAIRLGLDMNLYLLKKLFINKQRSWGKANKDGVIQHIREIKDVDVESKTETEISVAIDTMENPNNS